MVQSIATKHPHRGLDIGYGKSYDPLPGFTGVEIGDIGYDGKNLPYESEHFEIVFASHMLEHCPNPNAMIMEMYRVCRIEGMIIITVPHKFLYEKKAMPPSRFNRTHLGFYTPAKLLERVEMALVPNTYRIRRCYDDDLNYNYSIPPEKHACGGYQVYLEVQKIKEPEWKIL